MICNKLFQKLIDTYSWCFLPCHCVYSRLSAMVRYTYTERNMIYIQNFTVDLEYSYQKTLFHQVICFFCGTVLTYPFIKNTFMLSIMLLLYIQWHSLGAGEHLPPGAKTKGAQNVNLWKYKVLKIIMNWPATKLPSHFTIPFPSNSKSSNNIL